MTDDARASGPRCLSTPLSYSRPTFCVMHTTAQILASPITVDLLHYIAHGDIANAGGRWMLYGTIDIDAPIRGLAVDDLIELPPTGRPILTARGEDILAMS